jgi:hypothetical protein
MSLRAYYAGQMTASAMQAAQVCTFLAGLVSAIPGVDKRAIAQLLEATGEMDEKLVAEAGLEVADALICALRDPGAPAPAGLDPKVKWAKMPERMAELRRRIEKLEGKA